MQIEVWDTRFGTSVRVVVRHKGRFVNNKSEKQVVRVALDTPRKPARAKPKGK